MSETHTNQRTSEAARAARYALANPGLNVPDVARAVDQTFVQVARSYAEHISHSKRPKPEHVDRLSEVVLGIMQGKTHRQMARDLGCRARDIARDRKRIRQVFYVGAIDGYTDWEPPPDEPKTPEEIVEARTAKKVELAATLYIQRVYEHLAARIQGLPDLISADDYDDEENGAVLAYIAICTDLGWGQMASWFETAQRVADQRAHE